MYGCSAGFHQYCRICTKKRTSFRLQLYNNRRLKNDPGKESTKRGNMLGLRNSLIPRNRITTQRQTGL